MVRQPPEQLGWGCYRLDITLLTMGFEPMTVQSQVQPANLLSHTAYYQTSLLKSE